MKEEGNTLDLHNLKCDFGMHEGKLYTRIPVSYLKWMVNRNHPKAYIASAELARRGTVTPEIEITGHAIDRVSLRHMDKYLESRRSKEGIHAWLHRMAKKSKSKKFQYKKSHYRYNGITFVFSEEGETIWPVLKTVL